MNAHHRSIAKLFVAATLLLSLARLSFSQPIDLSGWEKSRWGMSDKDLIAVFGSRLQKLSKRQAFYKWHTDYVIPVELAGESYTVFFQMADDTDKLSQVLVRLNEMKSRTPREDLFNAMASSLAHDYGEPDAKTNDRYRFSSKFNGLELSHTWRFPMTTIELAYSWDDQIFASTLTVRYFPTRAFVCCRKRRWTGAQLGSAATWLIEGWMYRCALAILTLGRNHFCKKGLSLGRRFGKNIARRLMQRFEDYRLPDGLSAGDICSIESGSGGFGIVKILALEPGTVHIRLYKEKFASRPDLIDATGLSLGTVHDEDGFGCPLGEPAQCDVKVACVSVSVFDQKTMKPAVPPAVSYRDRRGR